MEMRKVKRRRGDAIVAIKKQMLRCSEQGRRRFKRGYLAGGGCGGDRGDAADSAIFYLACLVCTAPRPSFSASR
ncbi:hypothetical protein BAE44_0022530 [Dichanthelium oligosanthes]|uniref:Uncharacterized protein n=1 Tax=Dichanthelium oligosanthes TaxID=888268 RepID=A0A1E5UUD1_9POAL|nr:hypothetical protein BAE44_0022530 [Dichanthelium oligosanthes]